MIEIWNSNYRSKEYIYGKEPNVFFCKSIDKYKLSGKALFPADGEGRNSVYAALRGFNVSAFDISNEGRKKALALAQESRCIIDYRVGSLNEVDYGNSKFDVIVLIFAHFTPELLFEYHSRFVDMLNPNGYVILEGFSKANLEYRLKNPSIGGPPVAEMLFSPDIIANSFEGLEVVELEELKVTLNEGIKHIGEGVVVRYIGRKK